MTGEITLSGLVLPIGGIREKALAARRSGITNVILPALNEPDLAELPEEVRADMTFIPVETLEQVVNVAFDGKGQASGLRNQESAGRNQESAGRNQASATSNQAADGRTDS